MKRTNEASGWRKVALVFTALMITLVSIAQNQSAFRFDAGKMNKVMARVPNNSDTLFIEDAPFIKVDSVTVSKEELKKMFASKSKKQDTAYVPVYLLDITDTIPSTYIYGDNNLKRGSGFALIRGFKVQSPEGLKWATQPGLAGVLDDRKRLVPNVVLSTVVPIQEQAKPKQ